MLNGYEKINRRDFVSCTAAATVIMGSAVSSQAAVVKKPLPPIDMKFISDKLNFVLRSAWCDVKPMSWRMRGNAKHDRITIHHAGGDLYKEKARNSVIHTLSGIFQGHLEKEYGDIAYHLMIDYSGRVWEGRSLAYEGAHVSGNNEGNIGVMLLGNFQKQDISKEQLGSMKTLVSLLRDRFEIKAHRIYGHRDLSPSVCPGAKLYPYVEKIRS